MDKNFNPDKQHTLIKPLSISGTGLHSGINVDMTLRPANPGFGYQFQRTDLPFKLGGNEGGRGNGERLAVDPNDGRVLYLAYLRDPSGNKLCGFHRVK